MARCKKAATVQVVIGVCFSFLASILATCLVHLCVLRPSSRNCRFCRVLLVVQIQALHVCDFAISARSPFTIMSQPTASAERFASLFADGTTEMNAICAQLASGEYVSADAMKKLFEHASRLQRIANDSIRSKLQTLGHSDCIADDNVTGVQELLQLFSGTLSSISTCSTNAFVIKTKLQEFAAEPENSEELCWRTLSGRTSKLELQDEQINAKFKELQAVQTRAHEALLPLLKKSADAERLCSLLAFAGDLLVYGAFLAGLFTLPFFGFGAAATSGIALAATTPGALMGSLGSEYAKQYGRVKHALQQRLETTGVVIESKRRLQLKLTLVQSRITAATDSANTVGATALLVLGAATNETVESSQVSTVDAITELVDDLGRAKMAVKNFQQLAEDQVEQLGTRLQQRQPIASIQVQQHLHSGRMLQSIGPATSNNCNEDI